MDYLSIPHYRGLKSKYNKTEHDGGVYFTTDTHEIIANDVVYTKYINSWTISDGVLTLTMSDSSIITITFNEASETEKGFLSAEDKKRLNQFDALKEQVTELTQTVEDNELVTAQALNNLNDRINNTVIDDYLSSTSTNAVQNKIITTALSSKADLVTTGDGTKYLADDGVYKEVKTGKDTTVYDILINGGSTLTTDQLNTLSQYVTSTDELMSFDVGLSDSYPIRGVWGKREADSDGYLFYLDMVYPGMSQYFSAISIDSTGAVTESLYIAGVSYSETGPVLTYTSTDSGDVLNMTLVNNEDGSKFLSNDGTYKAAGKNTAVFEIINSIKVNNLTTLTTEQLAILQANVTSSNTTAFDLGISDSAYIFTGLSGNVENSNYTFYTVYSLLGLIPQYEIITIKSDGTITSDAKMIWLEAANNNITITAGTNINQTQIILKGSGNGTNVLADNGEYISHTPIVTLTQTDYDALETKDSSTLYIITE